VDSVQNDAVDVVPVNVSLDSSISVLVVRSLLDVNIMEAARFPGGNIQPHKRLGHWFVERHDIIFLVIACLQIYVTVQCTPCAWNTTLGQHTLWPQSMSNPLDNLHACFYIHWALLRIFTRFIKWHSINLCEIELISQHPSYLFIFWHVNNRLHRFVAHFKDIWSIRKAKLYSICFAFSGSTYYSCSRHGKVLWTNALCWNKLSMLYIGWVELSIR